MGGMHKNFMEQVYPLLKANTLYHVTEYTLSANFFMKPHETVILVKRLRKDAALHYILSVNWSLVGYDTNHLEEEHLQLREWGSISDKVEVEKLEKSDLPLFMGGKYKVTPNMARILRGEL